MSRKKPIHDLWLYHKRAKDVVKFNGKQLKKLLKAGYYISSMSELWFDSEEGLGYNNWVEEYAEGVWFMSQKDVEDAVRAAAREFSHLSRRKSQKVIPRAYKQVAPKGAIVIYLYMRDRGYRDYIIALEKK